MFGGKKRRHIAVDTMIGPNLKVNGDIRFEGFCHIDGSVKGSISAAADSNSELSIAEDGTVEGGVSVPYVTLFVATW